MTADAGYLMAIRFFVAFSVARLSLVRCCARAFSTRTVLVGPMLSLLVGEMWWRNNLLRDACLCRHVEGLIDSVLDSLAAHGYAHTLCGVSHLSWFLSSLSCS